MIDENARLRKELEITKAAFTSYKNIVSKILTKDQIDVLMGKKVPQYSPDTIYKAITIRYSMSQLSYERLKELYPLPSLATLKRYVQPLDFSEGVMPSVIEPLTAISHRLSSEDPNHPKLQCILIADEMSIDGRVMFDPSYKNITGTVSSEFLTSHQSSSGQIVTANKILVFMIKCIFDHAKQAVAWFFTSSLTGDMMARALKKVITDIETKSMFRIHGLCTDQGGANEGLWAKFPGSTSAPHPLADNRRLFFLIDISHLLKNLWNCMVTTELVIDSNSCQAISDRLSIPLISPVVSSAHSLDFFINLQETKQQVDQLIPRLTSTLLHPKDTWAKMRVYPTEVLFAHNVSKSLLLAASTFSTSEITTSRCHTMSAFISIMASFRDIATNTVSKKTPDLMFSESSFPLLHIVRNIFSGMTFTRNGSVLSAQQKPKFPSGFVRFIDSNIDLITYLGIKLGTSSIPLGELSSDFIENLFSRIKVHGDPTPVQVPIRMQATTIKSTGPVSRSQNAPERSSTSYIQPSDVDVDRNIRSTYSSSHNFEEGDHETNPDHYIIMSEMSENVLSRMSSQCNSCQHHFNSNPLYIRELRQLFHFIMNTIDKNISILRQQMSVIEFVPWMLSACDLESYPSYPPSCHALVDLIIEFLLSYFTHIELRYERSSIIYSSKSSLMKSIASHK